MVTWLCVPHGQMFPGLSRILPSCGTAECIKRNVLLTSGFKYIGFKSPTSSVAFGQKEMWRKFHKWIKCLLCVVFQCERDSPVMRLVAPDASKHKSRRGQKMASRSIATTTLSALWSFSCLCVHLAESGFYQNHREQGGPSARARKRAKSLKWRARSTTCSLLERVWDRRSSRERRRDDRVCLGGGRNLLRAALMIGRRGCIDPRHLIMQVLLVVNADKRQISLLPWWPELWILSLHKCYMKMISANLIRDFLKCSFRFRFHHAALWWEVNQEPAQLSQRDAFYVVF